MIGLLSVVRWIALCGPALWLFASVGTARSDPCPSAAISPRPFYGGCTTCVPNVGSFGYYPTTWRRWPGEERPAETFPQSIGAESIPAPEPEGPIPAPFDEPRRVPGGVPIPDPTLPDGPPSGPLGGDSLLPPREPVPESPALPEAEEPAEPPAGRPAEVPAEPNPMPLSPGGPADSFGPPESPLDEPSPLPGMEDSPLAEPPGASGLPESEPALPGEPAAPAPLDPTGEDPIPGLRSLPADGGAAAAAPMPGDILSAPSLVPATPPMPGDAAKAPTPTRATRPEVASSQGEPVAPAPGSAGVLPAEARDQWVASRPDWRSSQATTPAIQQPGDEPRDDAAEEPSEHLQTGPAALPIAEMPPVAPLPPRDEAATESDTDADADVRGDAQRDTEPMAPADAPALRIPQDEPPSSLEVSSPEPPSPKTSSLKPAAFIVGQATPLDAADSRPADLDGFCLYELSANERWVEGNPRWSAEYSGRKYLFSSQEHRDRFLADPTRYAPAYAGHDPVLAVEAGRRIPGKTDYCVNYDGRLYMLSSGVTLARFQRDPARYASRN